MNTPTKTSDFLKGLPNIEIIFKEMGKNIDNLELFIEENIDFFLKDNFKKKLTEKLENTKNSDEKIMITFLITFIDNINTTKNDKYSSIAQMTSKYIESIELIISERDSALDTNTKIVSEFLDYKQKTSNIIKKEEKDTFPIIKAGKVVEKYIFKDLISKDDKEKEEEKSIQEETIDYKKLYDKNFDQKEKLELQVQKLELKVQELDKIILQNKISTSNFTSKKTY